MLRRQKINQGLTLIETLVAMSIFTLAVLAVGSFIIYFYRGSDYTLKQSWAVDSARRGIETVVREIREATDSDLGSYPVVEADPQALTFYSDIDYDLNIERIRYFLEGTSFQKGVTKVSGTPVAYKDENETIITLSDYVRNDTEAIFTYYDSLGQEISDLDRYTDIRMVRVRLIINIDPSRPPNEYTLISNATLRNLKTE